MPSYDAGFFRILCDAEGRVRRPSAEQTRRIHMERSAIIRRLQHDDSSDDEARGPPRAASPRDGGARLCARWPRLEWWVDALTASFDQYARYMRASFDDQYS